MTAIMKEQLTMQQTQAISLEILRTVADICEAQNLRYALIYGTLIGAVRHHDYIPWDDDVDIMMPRPDYDKLLAYLDDHIGEYPNLKVFNRQTCKDYPYMITRISDDRYVIEMENEKPYGMGVFIDIYPYDGLGVTKEEAVRYGLKGDRLSSLCYQASRDHFAMETTTSALRKLLKFPVYLVAKLCGKDFFQKKLEKLARVKDYDTSEYVGCVIWLSWGEKDIFPRKWFDETIMMPFGKYSFRVPKEYDAVLRHEYGDYMQLPPEKDRIGHHFYKVYKK
jgi:lipopolysaccharide cholinephosphotransferase